MEQNVKLNMDNQIPFEINHKYKDCLLRIAFREKKDLLELYNAINGSDYQDPDELIVYTLEDVVFMGIKNDISFLIGEMLNLYEHQSTKNPNMPIRGLMYFARNYASYIARNDLDIYGTVLQKLPFPQYYVLYNGREDEEDRCTIELEDAFPKIEGIEPCLKCTATLLNINYGHNREIMERCKRLDDYAIYVQRIRDKQSLGMILPEAVDKATNECIREGILRDILLKNQAEVKNMVLGVWGTETHLRKVREEQERDKKKIEEMEERKIELEQEASELKRETSELKRRKSAIDLLTQRLLDSGKLEELRKASLDEDYQAELLKKYDLI
ncbi:MAG: hypothetical protein Q4C52_12700 [Eubacteriales bacterium]|nr:hypothetical protein [Eubacteriales bacterium]